MAVIGGSFLPGLTGHNILEAAAAGCAVLTGEYFLQKPVLFASHVILKMLLISGHHVGHFSDMVLKMQRSNPLSVLQVRRASCLFSLFL